MMRVFVIVLAWWCSFALAAAQPQHPEIVVGASGDQVTQVDQEFLKYAITQGGLFLLLVAVGWSYRRDFLRKQKQTEEDARRQLAEEQERRREEQQRTDQLLALLVKTTDAIAKNEAATSRLSRALEQRRLVGPNETGGLA
jgi:flagellar biosynthesis/type III secretory pathway M-ring protein FliF/YscJ